MKKNNTVAIKLFNVKKKYVIHHEKPTLVEKFIKNKNEIFTALDDINLIINRGEKVGIVGINGSGKTTLLKIITGLTSPTEGKIEIFGRIVSLIDLQAGFHPELTGYQNIFLNGLILGMHKYEIEQKVNDIIKFADIHQFIDTPLFTYSSGMMLRLGFSIAIYTNPDILILDENFSVGDENFQVKSKKMIEKLIKKGATIIIASHSLKFLETVCTRGIWLDFGKIKIDGPIKKVTNEYRKHQK